MTTLTESTPTATATLTTDGTKVVHASAKGVGALVLLCRLIRRALN